MRKIEKNKRAETATKTVAKAERSNDARVPLAAGRDKGEVGRERIRAEQGRGEARKGRNLAKQGRSRTTQERLVETARVLFWERGYNATSVADVLEQSKVHAGSMYYHFKTKEELLLAVLEKYKEMLRPALLAPVWQKVSDPIERVFGLLAVYREGILATDFGYGCPLGRLAMEIDPGMREVHAGIAANFEAWSGAVAECLESARGRLPKAVDVRTLSRFVLTVMEGGVMQSRSYRSIEPFDQCVTVLRDYFKRLLDEGSAQGMVYRGTLKI
jgi:TetR/AcrR family transcriptional repressor of nem operon